MKRNFSKIGTKLYCTKRHGTKRHGSLSADGEFLVVDKKYLHIRVWCSCSDHLSADREFLGVDKKYLHI